MMKENMHEFFATAMDSKMYHGFHQKDG